MPGPATPARARLPPLPGVVKTLAWVSLLNDIATEMAYPLLPAFLRSIGAGAASLGMMEGVAESVSSLIKWLTGRASDGRGRKPFVVAGYGLASVVRPALAVATSAWQVVAVRATDRVGKGLRSAPRDALLAGAVGPEQRGYAFGFHQMMDNIGAVVGPLVAFTLLRTCGLSMRAVFALTIVPGLLAFFWVLRVRETAPTEPKTTPVSASASAPLPGRLRAYLALVVVFTLGASADSFLLLRMVDLGLDAALTPIVWMSLNASKALLNVAGGKLSDRLGRKRTQVAGWLVYGAAYALFPMTRSIALTWALLVLYGAYYGLTEGGEKALVADLAPAACRGRAFGALHAITGFAVLPANALFGVLYGHHVTLAFGVSAACAGAAAIGLALLPLRREHA